MSRAITAAYQDPLAEIWRGCARKVGLQVTRTADAYAATDGDGKLALGRDDCLDADDSLAQMIFHELCHSLVEGVDAFARADWGLDNTSNDDAWREHACLRTQWVLAQRYGLRGVLAPTTDFRTFWDGLAGDVLADRSDPSVRAAIVAIDRADRSPWGPHVEAALRATATIAAAVSSAGPDVTSLWHAVVPAPPLHPSGLPAGATDGTCGTCAWRYEGGPGRRAIRCRQADGRRVEDAYPGCERYDAALDCLTCGACCREAYQSVEVGPRERFNRTHPEYVIDKQTYREIRRNGDRCAALVGGIVETRADGSLGVTDYACVVYPDRPRTCREFTLGSHHCLDARRRVGLSL